MNRNETQQMTGRRAKGKIVKMKNIISAAREGGRSEERIYRLVEKLIFSRFHFAERDK